MKTCKDLFTFRATVKHHITSQPTAKTEKQNYQHFKEWLTLKWYGRNISIKRHNVVPPCYFVVKLDTQVLVELLVDGAATHYPVCLQYAAMLPYSHAVRHDTVPPPQLIFGVIKKSNMEKCCLWDFSR